MQFLSRLFVFSLFAGPASLAFAHHGWSWYGSEEFTLAAEIVQTRLGNPHDRLLVRDSDGQQWDVLLSPPSRSRRAGFSEQSIEEGDTVTLFGHRHSDPDNFEMKTERIQVGDQVYDLYPSRS